MALGSCGSGLVPEILPGTYHFILWQRGWTQRSAKSYCHSITSLVVIHPANLPQTLRYHLYHHSKKTIVDLPPTSCSGRGHILQAFYGTYLQLHCLDDAELNPCEFEIYQDDGALLPDIKQALLSDDFPMPCRCTACATKRCPCRQNEIKYCPYCSCQAV